MVSDLGRIQFLELVFRKVRDAAKDGQNGSAAFAFDRLLLIQQYAETALAQGTPPADEQSIRADERERCAQLVECLGKRRAGMWVCDFVRELAATIRDS